MLRGLLTLTLAKPTRIRKIDMKLKGTSKTEWPEGIGPRRLEVTDEIVLIDESFTFFNAANNSKERRAASIGPGWRDSEFDTGDREGRLTSRALSMMPPARDTSVGHIYYTSRDGRGVRSESPAALRRAESRQSTLEPARNNRSDYSPHHLASSIRSLSQSPHSTPPAGANGHHFFSSANADPSSSRHSSDEDAQPLSFSNLMLQEQSGTQSAPIPSSVRSSLEHLPLPAQTTRNFSSELAPTESRSNRRPSFASIGNQRPSIASTGDRRPSIASTGEQLSPSQSRMGVRDRSRTPTLRTPSANRFDGRGSSPDRERHPRFNIGSVFRGKSKSREPSKENGRSRLEVDGACSNKDRSQSRGRAKGLKALREALVAGLGDNDAKVADGDSDEELDGITGDSTRATGWREFKVSFLLLRYV